MRNERKEKEKKGRRTDDGTILKKEPRPRGGIEEAVRMGK